MDRAAKTRKYRKKARKAGSGRGNARYIWVSAVFLIVIATAVLLLSRKTKPQLEAAYMTKEELNAMLEAVTGQVFFQDAGMEYVTAEDFRECVRKLGLSEILPIPDGTERLSREAICAFYEEILEYLDLGGKVQKKKLLYLKDKSDGWLTDKGLFSVSVPVLQAEAFQRYEVYSIGKKILGIKGTTGGKTSLKNVEILKINEKRNQIKFKYKKDTYQLSYHEYPKQLQEGVHCTLYIRDGTYQSAKDIKKAKHSESQSAQVSVILLNKDKIYRNSVYVACNGKYQVINGKKKSSYQPKELFSSKSIKSREGTPIRIVPKKASDQLYLTDAGGNVVSNGYYGSFYIYKDKSGYYIVNKVNVEKYLYSVVASEMPSSFHEEALKAQAVCARSYVYRQMEEAEEYKAYHAQIDDSTNYQVYNKSEVTGTDKAAVDATAGKVMYYHDELVNAYYFSTSCGYSSGMEIWNRKGEEPYLKARALYQKKSGQPDLSNEKEFRSYISKADPKAFDSESPYFRWKARVELGGRLSGLKKIIQERRRINPSNITYQNADGKKADSMEGFGGISAISCNKRSKSGAILELLLRFEYGSVLVCSEYNIRAILGYGLEEISYADGSKNTSSRFLPSAYFSIDFEKKSKRFVLTGGGNGHGMGMSQYGADAMGRLGWSYKKILQFSYDGIEIRDMA